MTYNKCLHIITGTFLPSETFESYSSAVNVFSRERIIGRPSTVNRPSRNKPTVSDIYIKTKNQTKRNWLEGKLCKFVLKVFFVVFCCGESSFHFFYFLTSDSNVKFSLRAPISFSFYFRIIFNKIVKWNKKNFQTKSLLRTCYTDFPLGIIL